MLIIAKFGFAQLTIQLSFDKPCMNIICIFVPCDLLSTFKSTHGFKPCVKADVEDEQMQGNADLFEEEYFDDPTA